jgi:hypothetical protein
MVLVGCSTVGVSPRDENAVAAEVRVVDAFIGARVALNPNSMATVLHPDARIVDMRRDPAESTGADELYRVLPLSETFEVGPRHVNQSDEVTWTEEVLHYARPGREGNLDLLMDDILRMQTDCNSSARGACHADQGRPTNYKRTVSATVLQSKITWLKIMPPESPAARIATPYLDIRFLVTGMLMAAVTVLLAWRAMSSRSTSTRCRPVHNRRTIVGLKTWLAAGQASRALAAAARPLPSPTLGVHDHRDDVS